MAESECLIRCPKCDQVSLHLLDALEVNQPKAESDSTACCPAGYGAVEHVTAGRCPDRDLFAKVRERITMELDEVYGYCIAEAGSDKFGEHCKKIFQQLDRLDPGEASG